MKENTYSTNSIPLLVGTYNSPTSKGIYQLSFNPHNGTLSGKKLLAETNNPSFLALSKEYVFSVNEGNPGSISAFKWNQPRDSLLFINRQSSEGASPCYISYNPDIRLLATANYSTGNLAFFRINENGSISDIPDVRQHEGSGPVLPNQQSARAHCIQFGPTGKFIYAADLGIDQILAYPITSDGDIGVMHTALALDPGDGPRHFVFHPQGDRIFIVNELSSTVVSASIDHSSGKFNRIDKVSTLPIGYTGQNFCADIHISEDGKFLYASNRGHNSIAVFAVDDESKLTLLQTESVQGEWPRNFVISPEETYLLVANQNSNNITVFNREKTTGRLTYSGQQIDLGKPVCLKFY